MMPAMPSILITMMTMCIMRLMIVVMTMIMIRLVNHRLNDIVQRNYELFSKLHLDGLCLMGKNSGKIARFNPNSYRRNSTSNKAVYTHELEVPQIDRPLRHVHCNSVTLEHVKVDYIVLQALKRSLKYSFRQMDFLYCMLNVNNQAEFAYLLREWNVQKLSFAHCNWPENSEFYSISDKLFEFNPQLQHVSISFDKVTNIKISDTTLKKWASCTSWPRSFILHNVKSEITHEGVAAVISSYVAQARAKRDKVFGSTILWNFGVVNTSLDWLTPTL
uniref:Uncharacterized protein n=1 Tax=Acrobeloides nanus TaxID=290746 RepID=A0A914EF75_9BILA